ncbi:MAG: hypothetical protein H6599_03960 [Flavobacteriales bacterium]|nr:hypothetical protein [Flavobacteriales bacterium]
MGKIFLKDSLFQIQKTKFIIVLIIFAVSLSNMYAGVYYSNGAGGGDWMTPGTWSPAGPPTCGDTIYIQDGDIVQVTSIIDYNNDCGGPPMFLEIYGTLQFDGGGSKLRLPGGSGIMVYAPNGLIEAIGSRSSNSKNIQIGATVVWDANDLPVGPGGGFGSPLGNELIYFKGEIINDFVELRWLVEGSFEGVFEVEKSYDNNSWVSVGTIDGLGMNASEYFIEDEKPKLNQTFYRLTYHALDGEISNLGVIVINNKVEGQLSFRIIPNPTEGKEIQIVVSSNHSEAVHAYVIDAFGHIFYTGELIVLEGDQIFTLRPNLDAFGLFYVNLRSSSISLTDKVIIHK